MRFVVAVTKDVPGLLADKVEAARKREQEWLTEQLQLARLEPTNGERAAARAAARKELARRRADGESLGTVTALITWHTRQILTDNNWLTSPDGSPWPVIPAGQESVPGRRWGITPEENDNEETKLSGRLSLDLPEDLGHTVRRAAYWISAPAVAELQAWQDRHGPGPGAAMGEGGAIGGLMLLAFALRGGPSADEMDRRDQLRTQVITTGEILRLAVTSALS